MKRDKTTEYALAIIHKLLSLPAGEQLYRQEIKTLMDLVKTMVYPVIVVKNKHD